MTGDKPDAFFADVADVVAARIAAWRPLASGARRAPGDLLALRAIRASTAAPAAAAAAQFDELRSALWDAALAALEPRWAELLTTPAGRPKGS
jgi:hypothetical protein